MPLQTKYIKTDDFKDYFNIDLVAALKTTEQAESFLKRIEDRLQTYIDAEYYRNVDKMFPEFSDYQKERYKLALLEQAIYVFRNGDLSVQSGYSIESGKIGNPHSFSLAPNCRDNLLLCGLINRNIKPRGFYAR